MTSLSERLNRLFMLSMVGGLVIVLAVYVILIRAHKYQVSKDALVALEHLSQAQAPYFVQEIVNEQLLGAVYRAKGLIDQHKDIGLEIAIYRLDGTPVFESQRAMQLFSPKGPDQKSKSLSTGSFVIHSVPLKFADDVTGKACFAQKVDLSHQATLGNAFLVASGVLFVSLLFLFLVSRSEMRRCLVAPIQRLARAVPGITGYVNGESPTIDIPRELGSTELNMLGGALSGMSERLRTAIDEKTQVEVEIERRKAVEDLARKVAHDIRSPVTALAMLAGDLSTLPEEKRVLMRNALNRIHEIANDLLQRGETKPQYPNS